MNGCCGPWWSVSRRALNLMEDILSTYYKIILSAATHKLNVSGHMLIWTFSSFGMWNSCPKFVRNFHLHSVYSRPPNSDRSVSDHSQVRLFRIVTSTHESGRVARKSSRIRRCSPTTRRHLYSFSWISKLLGVHRSEIVHVYLCLYTVTYNLYY
jgi:hypothetical protein